MFVLLSRNWWMLALRGLFAVLFGIAAFVWPAITITALVLLFGAYVLIDGLFAVVAAFRERESYGQWWLLLLEGGAGIAAGILTLIWPGITAFILLYLIAGWALITGFFEILAAIRLRQEIEGEWLFVLSGILSLLFGGILIIRPGAGALAVVWLIAIYAIAFGGLLIILALRLRGGGDQSRVSPEQRGWSDAGMRLD